jgi:hypothetical protein
VFVCVLCVLASAVYIAAAVFVAASDPVHALDGLVRRHRA